VSPDDVIPGGDPDIGFFVALMAIGFVVGIAGHVVRSNGLIATGIALIFFSVFVFPLLFLGGG
jgi:hypothetical protein